MKTKVGIIFGGTSTEHEVSVVSGTSIIKNIDKNKYEVLPIFIDKNGEWYIYDIDVNNISILHVGDEPAELKKIENIVETLKSVDVIFPVLHGLYGEDGTIQGLLELIKKPYVGCRVLASSVCMDKAYTKVILEKAGIPQVKHIYIRRISGQYEYVDEDFNFEKMNIEDISNKIVAKLGLPVFIKPSNSGSSVGINKASTIEEIKKYIDYAAKFDSKIIVEEAVNAREIECAVLGNDDIEASVLGEIMPAEEFYTFDAKYNNAESKTKAPALVDENTTAEIRKIAVKAFKAVDGKGLARVDFFVDKNSGKIYLNEINTMPGFTTISMYPQLFEKCGLTYEELIEKLITLAVEG